MVEAGTAVSPLLRAMSANLGCLKGISCIGSYIPQWVAASFLVVMVEAVVADGTFRDQIHEATEFRARYAKTDIAKLYRLALCGPFRPSPRQRSRKIFETRYSTFREHSWYLRAHTLHSTTLCPPRTTANMIIYKVRLHLSQAATTRALYRRQSLWY